MGAHPGAFWRRKRMPPRGHDKMTMFIKIAPIAKFAMLGDLSVNEILIFIEISFGHEWAIASFDKTKLFNKCSG